MKDIEAQVEFIGGAVNRILWQIDGDLLSPTFGCAHPAYWRDKTYDFADMRRQEAMLTLALLYSNDYPGSSWEGDEKLRRAVESLLSFWCKNQYPDGSMDEWYKGERAFAAAAFTTHAAARTLLIMKDRLSEEIIALSRKKLQMSAGWLTRHNDLFKTNHQAVSVAALAWAAEALQKGGLKDNAEKKLQSILKAQTKEGWFPELGSMDVGYTFLTVEFILMAMDLWQDHTHVEPFRRAFDFACEWVHPDMAIGSEYGICQNTYLSRIAVILMSGFSGRAAYLRKSIEKDSYGFKGYSSTLADDLRLLRWAYQPLLAYDYDRKAGPPKSDKSEPIPLSNPQGRAFLYYNESAIARFSCGKGTGVFAPVSGGLARFFNPASAGTISDYGYAVTFNARFATNFLYNKNVIVKNKEEVMEITSPVSCVEKLMPPFWARVLLRVFSSTSFGSGIARKCIDIIRKKKATALNQSSGNLRSSKSIGELKRRILLEKGGVTIKDRLIFNGPVKKEDIFFLESFNDNWIARRPLISGFSNLPTWIKDLEIIKFYRSQESWSLENLSVNVIK